MKILISIKKCPLIDDALLVFKDGARCGQIVKKSDGLWHAFFLGQPKGIFAELKDAIKVLTK